MRISVWNYEFFATKNVIFKRMSFYLAESFVFIYIPLKVPLTAHFNFTRCFDDPHYLFFMHTFLKTVACLKMRLLLPKVNQTCTWNWPALLICSLLRGMETLVMHHDASEHFLRDSCTKTWFKVSSNQKLVQNFIYYFFMMKNLRFGESSNIWIFAHIFSRKV